MTNLIGIPNQGYANKKTEEAKMEAMRKVDEARYHMTTRLEFARLFPLQVAKLAYDHIKDKPYPEISYWKEAVQIHVLQLQKLDVNIMELIPDEINKIHNFLLNAE